jgi:deoxyribodipyrimidine photolyase-related protein
MNCLKDAINQSLNFAYAHHIQRLMITGNFALLAGVHPDEIDAWYLGIYIDAIEWVDYQYSRNEPICLWWYRRNKTVRKLCIISINEPLLWSCFYKKEVKTGEPAHLIACIGTL